MSDEITFYLADCDSSTDPIEIAKELELYEAFLSSLEVDEYESSNFRYLLASKVVLSIEELLGKGESASCQINFRLDDIVYKQELEKLEESFIKGLLINFPAVGIQNWKGTEQVLDLLKKLKLFCSHDDFDSYRSDLLECIEFIESNLCDSTNRENFTIIGMMRFEYW